MSDLAAANAVIGNLYRSIGAQLTVARHERGVRQDDLAKAVGLTRGSITNIERGTQRIQVHTMVAAAQSLGLDPADMITRALEGQLPITTPVEGITPREAALLTRRLTAARDHITALLDQIAEETP